MRLDHSLENYELWETCLIPFEKILLHLLSRKARLLFRKGNLGVEL